MKNDYKDLFYAFSDKNIHRHLLRLLITMTKTTTIIIIMGGKDLETREDMGDEGKGNKKESRYIMHMYLLPQMNANFMYCKYVLIK